MIHIRHYEIFLNSIFGLEKCWSLFSTLGRVLHLCMTLGNTILCLQLASHLTPHSFAIQFVQLKVIVIVGPNPKPSYIKRVF